MHFFLSLGKQKLSELAIALKNSCLPKLICELNASTEKDKFTAKAKYLLQLLRYVCQQFQMNGINVIVNYKYV